MDNYNFWSDLLDTWQSTADWIKALAILTPPAAALAALALVLHYRRARRPAEPLPAGTLAYALWRDGYDRLHVVRHEHEPLLGEPSVAVVKVGPEGVESRGADGTGGVRYGRQLYGRS